ncbi:MAG: acyl-CoA mutase large subunit family protein [Verrucomicrobiales bacterium]|nr:acyl-CoA mutase large subunit family protein [Verrucomicrobiales bacterium]
MPEPTTDATTPALLTEFPAVTPDQWKALVESELKGAPFDKKMFSTSYEGIVARPIYRPEDAAGLAHMGSLPGFAPYVRGTRADGYLKKPWEVSQEIAEPGAAAFNDTARAGLARGLTALNVVLDRATRNGADPDWAPSDEVGLGGLSLALMEDLNRALDGIDLATVPLFIRSGASGLPCAALLVALARKRQVDLHLLRGCIEIDPLGVLAHSGQLPQSLDGAYREMAALTSWAAVNAPGLQTLCVHSRAWHESGGSAVQELAFTLATALDYLRAMHVRGLGVDLVAPRMRFAFTVGTQFFTEIAKLRAARLLWSRLISSLGGSEEAQKASVHVRTSQFNKTVYDPYVNMLRTTVEAFAGVLGGCDSMQVGPFDEILRSPGEFSQRIARNQQLVLREECHLTRVIDPAGGSWYIENLTDDLARRAWALFQEVEKRGGMAAALTSGWPQVEVSKTAEKRLENVARRRESVVGTNVYANPGEKPLDIPGTDAAAFYKRRAQQVASARTSADEGQHQAVMDQLAQVVGGSGPALFEACARAASAGATLGEITRAVRIQDRPNPPITPVCLTRVSSQFEGLRTSVDRRAAADGRRPAVFLANLGPLKQHKARADFARGFFEVAGFEVVNPQGFKTPAEAAAAAHASGAEVVCICSTDETYPELVPPLAREVREGRPGVVLVLAGFPADQVDQHRASGIDEFIHIRANALEVLSQISKRLGITA